MQIKQKVTESRKKELDGGDLSMNRMLCCLSEVEDGDSVYKCGYTNNMS